MSYKNYTKLNDEQCAWVLSQTGRELFAKCKKLLEEDKISEETAKQMNALWLNERNINGKWAKYKHSEMA